jgi:hypothetical protein
MEINVVIRGILIAGLGILLVSGCAMKQKKIEHTLENPAPIHCGSAEGDIRVLESENVNAAERLAEGVMAITPAGAALGILTWTEPTKIKVATGKYNEMLDKRIAEIKQECGLP